MSDTPAEQTERRRFGLPDIAWFKPILVGATLRDRVFACVGAMIGIALAGLLSAVAVGDPTHTPLLMAPLGASAVLVFALPASPLAQPWPVIGGNTISAIVGVTVALVVHDLVVASGLAVGLAIIVMSLTRSLHPPGGAVALTGVIGATTIASSGYEFAFALVALNSGLLVAAAWGFHRFSGHSYPHVAPPAPAPASPRVHAEDVDAAIAQLGETLDINRQDLDRLLIQIELNAAARQRK